MGNVQEFICRYVRYFVFKCAFILSDKVVTLYIVQALGRSATAIWSKFFGI